MELSNHSPLFSFCETFGVPYHPHLPFSRSLRCFPRRLVPFRLLWVLPFSTLPPSRLSGAEDAVPPPLLRTSSLSLVPIPLFSRKLFPSFLSEVWENLFLPGEDSTRSCLPAVTHARQVSAPTAAGPTGLDVVSPAERINLREARDRSQEFLFPPFVVVRILLPFFHLVDYLRCPSQFTLSRYTLAAVLCSPPSTTVTPRGLCDFFF